METKTRNLQILKLAAEKLLKAQQEIDEMVLQISLGKMEAADTLEELKSDFRKKVQEIQQSYKASNASEAMASINKLLAQLAVGKALTKEMFEEQKKELLNALREFESEMKEWWQQAGELNFFEHETAIFKLKLEILWLKANLKKVEWSSELKDRIHEGRRKVEQLTQSIHNSLEKGKDEIENMEAHAQDVFKFVKQTWKKMRG